jgi:hypothetical protein
MTALVQDAQRVEQQGKLIEMPVEAAAVIYKNAILSILPNGNVAPQDSATAGTVFAGIAYEAADYPAGKEVVRVITEGAFEFDGAGFVQADLGKEVYASNDNDVTIAPAANEDSIGRLVKVISATKVLVKLKLSQYK